MALRPRTRLGGVELSAALEMFAASVKARHVALIGVVMLGSQASFDCGGEVSFDRPTEGPLIFSPSHSGRL